jgi:photoactive yellow protein
MTTIEQAVETSAKRGYTWFDVSLSELFRELGAMRATDFDRLPFGAIKLTREGKVVEYNEAEAVFARRIPSEVIGRNFFHDIAPCTRVQEFYGRFVEQAWRGQIDQTFDFTFRFPHGWRQARIRMVSDSSQPYVYVFVNPLRTIAKNATAAIA